MTSGQSSDFRSQRFSKTYMRPNYCPQNMLFPRFLLFFINLFFPISHWNIFFFKLQPVRTSAPSSTSAHVSFHSPVESEARLPSLEQTFRASNNSTPSFLSSSLSPSLHQSQGSPPISVPAPDTKQDDKTLKMLQQHYMNAILSLNPQRKVLFIVGSYTTILLSPYHLWKMAAGGRTNTGPAHGGY